MNDEKLCYLHGAKEKGAQDTHKERLFNYTKGKKRDFEKVKMMAGKA
jgi:hypothetical protein